MQRESKKGEEKGGFAPEEEEEEEGEEEEEEEEEEGDWDVEQGSIGVELDSVKPSSPQPLAASAPWNVERGGEERRLEGSGLQEQEEDQAPVKTPFRPRMVPFSESFRKEEETFYKEKDKPRFGSFKAPVMKVR